MMNTKTPQTATTSHQSPIAIRHYSSPKSKNYASGKTRSLHAALRNLRDEHTRTIEPARVCAAEALQLEHQISDLVNEAYGLTPEEIDLVWKTAPPRMPISLDPARIE